MPVNIIAFDTAADAFALALSLGEKRYYLEIDGGRRHSELIMDAADTLLSIAGSGRDVLEAAACMEGPGSFTGLRIGFAAAKGIALALGIPVIAVPTLDCMAHSLSFWPGLVLPSMDAKKNAFFAALYRQGEKISPYMDSTPEELAAALAPFLEKEGESSLLLTGPGALLLFASLSPRFPQIRTDPQYRRTHAGELLNLAPKRSILDHTGSGPLYIRKSDAELNG